MQIHRIQVSGAAFTCETSAPTAVSTRGTTDYRDMMAKRRSGGGQTPHADV